MFTNHSLVLAFELAMAVTSLSATGAGLWLLSRSGGQGELKALAGFALAMAAWCLGHLLGPFWPAPALVLLLANPLMPTAFLDFACRFVATAEPPPWLAWLQRRMAWCYGAAGLAILVSLADGATLAPWPPFEHFIHLNALGWLNLAWTMAVGVLAHLVLLWGLWRHSGNRRRSIIAMFGVGAWGLLLASSFIFPSLGIRAFPWSMLLLPSYVLLLVFAVMRYRLLEVNRWAMKGVQWLVMLLALGLLIAALGPLAGLLGLGGLAQVPAWQLLLYGLLILGAGAWLWPRISTLARRLIFPGGELQEERLRDWQRQLARAAGWDELMARAGRLLGAQLGHQVQVGLTDQGGDTPQLLCRQLDGQWQVDLQHWQDSTPGQRLAAEVFASLLASACTNLAQSLALAEQEKQRLAQQHLVELGALSAAMAHELRNPLNIIAMAAAGCDQTVRGHIQQQIQRADLLIKDMLVYGGELNLAVQPLRLAGLIRGLALDGVTLAVPDGLELRADPFRVTQVLDNLLSNARAFAREQILLEAGRDDAATWIRVHNDGPAVAAAIRDRLFQPFVSKRPGGSGLGLAIVGRIMAGHGGSARLRTDLGWPVSFEIRFPLEVHS
ncbi:ATP-binding protein [Gallaecimonas sp. GXIMD4217]|uniref:sensor histidine kinase n=1 Tax=Gallaecimonas sp. GXIMD4217 TaxID=3131927 RepID=UPI00311B0020